MTGSLRISIGSTQREYFRAIVGDSIVKRSLEHAERVWKALVERRETRELRKTLRMFEEMGFTE